MKVLQINTTLNTGSTGRIAENIGQKLIANGHESYIAYSRRSNSISQSATVKIGNKPDVYLHGILTRLLDRHGFGSKNSTRAFIEEVRKIDPDLIGLHNLHGYYLNIEVLFGYLKVVQKPVVWTLHDCWPFTGHCSYFDAADCMRWKEGCFNCPLKTSYPASYLIDNSENNYRNKRQIFNGVENLTIITPSNWLAELVKKSFLKNYPVHVIHNGIDLKTFNVEGRIMSDERKIVLGVASTWDRRKGLSDFVELSKKSGELYHIILIGLTKKQIESLPPNITGIERTESVEELALYYRSADVFLNPTWSDNFPTTNIEALASGTPVITYDTGGSPEAIDAKTGIVVERGDIQTLHLSILKILSEGKNHFQEHCRKRAENLFSNEDRFEDYIQLYDKLVSGNHE